MTLENVYKVTYQLAACSSNRLFTEPILAPFSNFIGWVSVIRLRNFFMRWVEAEHEQ